VIILFDIGNTNTHLGLADAKRVLRQGNIPTADWLAGNPTKELKRFAGAADLKGAALCSVVPKVTPKILEAVTHLWSLPVFQLTSATLSGVGLNYPKPSTIGPDRLANAVAIRHRFGAPAVAVGFGTAVAFDVVDRHGDYAGGIIGPGLAAMTDYLHEKTALLPRIKIRDLKSVIGKSTEEAMLIGAVHGYRGLIRQIIHDLKGKLKARRLPVIATGGYAELMAAQLPEITAVDPLLTLEGLRLEYFDSLKGS
jgi:type III pantothenate kinase